MSALIATDLSENSLSTKIGDLLKFLTLQFTSIESLDLCLIEICKPVWPPTEHPKIKIRSAKYLEFNVPGFLLPLRHIKLVPDHIFITDSITS